MPLIANQRHPVATPWGNGAAERARVPTMTRKPAAIGVLAAGLRLHHPITIVSRLIPRSEPSTSV